jgi:hypothetical protein
VLLGQGDGTFHVGNIISTGGAVRNAIAGGDLNGDGLTDLVLTDKTQVTALLNETNQDTGAPTAAVDIMQPAQTLGSATITFNVTYTDARQIDTTTLGNGNLTVSFGGGAPVAATLVSANLPNASSVTVTYSIPAPSGALSPSDNGTYNVTATADASQAVKNANGIPVASGAIGSFSVQVSANQNGPNLVAQSLTVKIPKKAKEISGKSFRGSVKLLFANLGNQTASGKLVIDLFALTDLSLQGNPSPLKSVPKKIKLKAGKHMSISLGGFKWSSTFNGSYFLIAEVNATGAIAETSNADNFAVSGSAVAVTPLV